jgi:hypothetical protein
MTKRHNKHPVKRNDDFYGKKLSYREYIS